jgi:hypothetical protein
MYHKIVIVPFLTVRGMALFPFILLKKRHYSTDKTIINHELIHFKQQLELLILPFYIIYLLNYLINLLIYRDHDQAYRNIIFEREAYRHERDSDYLGKRRFWGWRLLMNDRMSE